MAEEPQPTAAGVRRALSALRTGTGVGPRGRVLLRGVDGRISIALEHTATATSGAREAAGTVPPETVHGRPPIRPKPVHLDHALRSADPEAPVTVSNGTGESTLHVGDLDLTYGHADETWNVAMPKGGVHLRERVAEAVVAVSEFTSRDWARPVLTRVDAWKGWAAATDSYRLGVMDCGDLPEAGGQSWPQSYRFPRSLFTRMRRLGPRPWSYAWDGEKDLVVARAEADGWTWTVQTEGFPCRNDYPNYPGLRPKDSACEIVLDRRPLLKWCDLITAANEPADRQARLGFDGGRVRFSSQVENEDPSIDVDAEAGGKPSAVCMRADFLATALRLMPEDEVCIRLGESEVKPVHIVAEGRWALVMPVRLYKMGP